MTAHYEQELVKEVKKMADELKSRIPATNAEGIFKTVVKYLK